MRGIPITAAQVFVTVTTFALVAGAARAEDCRHPDPDNWHHYHKYYALLVGSDAGEDIPIGVKNALNSWWNWTDNGRIEYLRDPNRQTILDRIEWHKDNVAPSDFFLFWYSGHGTFDVGRADEGGQALNAFDEALAIPRAGGGWDLLYDDRLALNDAFGGISCDKTLVFHSCYSGGMIRGGDGDLDRPAIEDIAVFTTSAENQTSWSDSSFATALINGLGYGSAETSGDTHLTIDEWWQYANLNNTGELVDTRDANGNLLGQQTPVQPQYYLDDGKMRDKFVAYGDFTAFPEPATLSLLAVGGLALIRERRRR